MCGDYFILMRIGHGPTELCTCTHSPRTLWRCLKMERGGCVWSTMLARISAENYTSKAGKAIWAKCAPLGCIFSLISTNLVCMCVCGVCMHPCVCKCASVGELGAGVKVLFKSHLGLWWPYASHFVHIASANPSVKQVHDHDHDHCLWAHMPRIYHGLPTVNAHAVTGPNVVGIKLRWQ